MKNFLVWLALLALACSCASAQVELVYKTSAETLVITSLAEGVPMYEQNGRPLAIPRDGTFEVRPAESYAKLNADAFLQYQVRQVGDTFMGPAGIAVAYSMDLVNGRNEPLPARLYYMCLWQVGEKITHHEIKNFSTGVRREIRVSGNFRIRPGEENGFLRVYALLDGRSIGGVAVPDVSDGATVADYLRLKSALDAGDVPAVRAWAQGQPKAALPSNLLQQLVAWGNGPAAEALLGNGASDKNLQGKKGGDLLQIAIKGGRKELVEVLLRRGVKAGQADAEGHLPMLAAAGFEDPEILSLLLESGADANATTFQQEASALSVAVAAGSEAAVECLLKHGAKWPTDKAKVSEWAPMVIRRGSRPLLERLLKNGADANFKEWKKIPLIYIAAQQNRLDLVQALVAAGATVDATDESGGTALMTAAAGANAGLVEFLLKSGASLKDTDSEKHTAVAWALIRGHAELAREIVTNHVHGQTELARLLAESVAAGDTTFASWLRSQGARLEVQSGMFEEAIDEAIRNGDLVTVKEAMAAGVSGNRHIRRDWTLAAAAQRYGRTEVLELFRAQAGDKLELAPPAVEKLPAQPLRFRMVPIPKELADQGLNAEAKVDFFIDYEGRPMFPVLKSSTDPRIDRLAIQTVMDSRFNQVAGKPWRRALVPVQYKQRPGGVHGDVVYWGELIDQVPVISTPAPESWAFVEAHAVDLALAEFIVDKTGAVINPAITATSTPAIAAASLEIARQWTYRPGTANDDVPVKCSGQGVVIMPEGRHMPTGVIMPLEALGAGGQPPRLRQKGSPADYGAPKEIVRPVASAVLLRYTIGKNGKTSDIRVLAATDVASARRAKLICSTAIYEPALKDGKPAAVNVIQCVAEETPDRFNLLNP